MRTMEKLKENVGGEMWHDDDGGREIAKWQKFDVSWYSYTAFHGIPTRCFMVFLHDVSWYFYTVFIVFLHGVSRYSYAVFGGVSTRCFMIFRHGV